jgi:twitching motility protein PilU
MHPITEDQARAQMHGLLATMAAAGGSDLFIAHDFPPSMKSDGSMRALSETRLTGEVTAALAQAMMNERQREEFAREFECNFAIVVPGVSRFRVNVFMQQQHVGMVLRTIAAEIPNFEKLRLPEILKDVVMNKRGLVLLVGGTGSGKSTSLAAMVDHRNRTSQGHIITIEDPVEYAHRSQQSLITHREVGVDTHSWHQALKNTLRQAPDVILVGEIRDAETMEHAIAFAETGHLCLSTLHANSASQTMERIVNFFPEERRTQLLMDLSANLRAIVSQRLVRTEDGKGRVAAIEILLLRRGDPQRRLGQRAAAQHQAQERARRTEHRGGTGAGHGRHAYARENRSLAPGGVAQAATQARGTGTGDIAAHEAGATAAIGPSPRLRRVSFAACGPKRR